MLRIALLILAIAAPAHADCPTRIEELPATGFLAATTRALLEPDAPEPPNVTARLGAAGGMQADADATTGTGTFAGQLAAQYKGLAGCASGEVIAAGNVSTHVTASAQIPLLFTGLGLGLTVDREVTLPFAARPEYLRAPASRIAAQFSISFVDLAVSDGKNGLRIMVVPFTLEEARDRQLVGEIVRERSSTRIETAMFRFAPNDGKNIGKLDIFGFASEWIDPSTTPMLPANVTGFVRIAPLTLENRGVRWGFVLDGGWLALAGGPMDCETITCTRGFYRFALSHAWEHVSLEGRAERSALIAADDSPAVDDRLSATATWSASSRQIATSAFGALTRPWLGGDAGRTGGVRVVATQELGRGFVAIVDGELARTYYGQREDAMLPAIEKSARLLLSLGWQWTGAR